MSSVFSRRIASTPARDAVETWHAIVALLTRNTAGKNRDALTAVTGIAASIVADQAPRDAAIVVTCDGPRTRIYCIYDDDAIDGSSADEGALSFDPLEGDWAVSLPCNDEDLAWVQNALKQHGDRITARDRSQAITIEEEAVAKAADTLVFNPKGFLGQ